jgi:transposase
VRRLEVPTNPERRRSCKDADKMRLVAETLEPGGCVVELARRHGLHPQQLYT